MKSLILFSCVFIGALMFPASTAAQKIQVLYGEKGDFAHLVAPQGSRYVWSPGGTTEQVLKIKAAPQTEATYTVEWYCGRCLKRKSANITLCSISLVPQSYDETHEGAKNARISLRVSGGTPPYRYQWNDRSANSDRTNLPSGTYSVTVTDQNRCQAIVENIIIGVERLQAHPQRAVATSSCPGNADASNVLLIKGGAPPYNIYLNETYIETTSIPMKTFGDLDIGEYRINVTDSKSSTVSTHFRVADPAPVHINLDVKHVTCFGEGDGKITTVISGGSPPYLLTWGDGPQVANRNNLQPGSYMVTITDQYGCRATSQAEVTQPLPVEYTAVKKDADCFGSATGEAKIHLPNADSYSITWGTEHLGNVLQNVPAGTYSFRIADDSRCTTGTIEIGQPKPIKIQPQLPNLNGYSIDCHGGKTGLFKIAIVGGFSPYKVFFHQLPVDSNPFVSGKEEGVKEFISDSHFSIDSLTSGMYWLEIIDAKLCRAVQHFVVTEPEPLGVKTESLKQLMCFRDSSGFALAKPYGGAFPYSLKWYAEDEFISEHSRLENLTSGNYRVQVEDANGCTVSAQTQILRRPKFVVIPNKFNGSLKPSGGVPPYREIAREQIKRGYKATFQDANGCICTVSVHRKLKTPNQRIRPRRNRIEWKEKPGRCPRFRIRKRILPFINLFMPSKQQLSG